MAIGAVNPYRARINGENKANRNRIAIATGAAIAGVATTLILAKKGKLNPVDGGNKIIEGIKKPLKKITDNIFNFIAGSKTIAKATTEIGKVQKKIAPKTQKASKIAEGVIADIETVAANVEGTIKGNVPKVKQKASKLAVFRAAAYLHLAEQDKCTKTFQYSACYRQIICFSPIRVAYL